MYLSGEEDFSLFKERPLGSLCSVSGRVLIVRIDDVRIGWRVRFAPVVLVSMSDQVTRDLIATVKTHHLSV